MVCVDRQTHVWVHNYITHYRKPRDGCKISMMLSSLHSPLVRYRSLCYSPKVSSRYSRKSLAPGSGKGKGRNSIFERECAASMNFLQLFFYYKSIFAFWIWMQKGMFASIYAAEIPHGKTWKHSNYWCRGIHHLKNPQSPPSDEVI